MKRLTYRAFTYLIVLGPLLSWIGSQAFYVRIPIRSNVELRNDQRYWMLLGIDYGTDGAVESYSLHKARGHLTPRWQQFSDTKESEFATQLVPGVYFVYFNEYTWYAFVPHKAIAGYGLASFGLILTYSHLFKRRRSGMSQRSVEDSRERM